MGQALLKRCPHFRGTFKLLFYSRSCPDYSDVLISLFSRIIQNYIVRDESGALVPPEADVHKEKFRRRSGIMASVFAGSAQKGSPEMTLAMSMEINRKMQAVLEDILIKNITLKVCCT